MRSTGRVSGPDLAVTLIRTRFIYLKMTSSGRERISEPQFALTIEVPFPSQRETSIAFGSLSPDQEPRSAGTTKHLSTSASVLSVKWRADEARSLRVSVASFLDHLALVMETMETFGPAALH